MSISPQTAEVGLPAKQARSRLTRDRLLAAGRRLLDQGAFEATSIAELAGAAGCSVGAFYHRFADKEAFFTALIETVLADVVAGAEQVASDENFAKGSIDATLANCVAYWVQAFRRHRGLIRTVMKKTLHAEESWTPVRRMARATVQPFIELLAAKCGKYNDPLFHYRALAGFQIIGGVMVNAALHRTVLLNLEGEELIAWANEILRHCVLDDLPPALLTLGAAAPRS